MDDAFKYIYEDVDRCYIMLLLLDNNIVLDDGDMTHDDDSRGHIYRNEMQ